MAARSDEALLTAAREDGDAFAELYRRHAPRILAFLVRRAGDAELAADVCAETFAAALVDLRRYDPAAGTPLAWLHGIARHKLADAQRRGQADTRARRRLGIPRLELTDEAIERIEALVDLPLDAALDGLPGEQAAAVRARVIDDRSYAEIALEHNTTEANARQRVARGLAGLRARLRGIDT